MDYHHKNIDNNFLTIIDINILQSHYRDWGIKVEDMWKKNICCTFVWNVIKS